MRLDRAKKLHSYLGEWLRMPRLKRLRRHQLAEALRTDSTDTSSDDSMCKAARKKKMLSEMLADDSLVAETGHKVTADLLDDILKRIVAGSTTHVSESSSHN